MKSILKFKTFCEAFKNFASFSKKSFKKLQTFCHFQTQFFFNLVFQPRQLGLLEPNTNCSLFGWGGALIIPRDDPVTILSSELCDSSFPDIFCSLLDSEDDEICTAQLGSPVMCGNVFAGFLINDGSCTTVDGQAFLKYQSVGEFGEWIQEVTEPEVEPISSFILSVAVYDAPDYEFTESRCAALAITKRHVITTASCVTVESFQGIVIETMFSEDNETVISSTLPVRVSIHPDYIESDGNSSNIAVILVRSKQKLFLKFSVFEKFPQEFSRALKSSRTNAIGHLEGSFS